MAADDDSSTDVAAVIGDYKPGSIKRIRLKNFLTHGNVDFCPGPRLNMVVGANGTGKSTILNAICLGLGGEPKLLGRADDLRAFIMHGQDKCAIEITLAAAEGQEQPHVLKRTIDRNKGTEKGRGRGASSFYINGEKTNIQKVRELVKETYNISIDNLCTFLPQDKVGLFSGFSDQDRLLETEKTLPTNQYFYKTHMGLIEKEETMEQSVHNVATIQDNLKKKKHEFEKLEIGKLREEERANAEQQVDKLQKKRLWLEFEMLRAECMTLKEQKTNLKRELTAAQAEIAPLKEKHERLQSQKKEMEAKGKSTDASIQKAQKEMDKQKQKYEKHDDEIDVLLADLTELDSKRSRLQSELDAANARMEKLQEQWDKFPDKEETEQKYTQAKDALRVVRKEFESAKREHKNLEQKFVEFQDTAHRLQQKLAEMNDDGARRKEKILRTVKNLGKIHSWIDNNRSMFRRPVYGPIAVEVTTKSQNTAAYLEFHVPNRVMNAFVVETKEDNDKLYDQVRKKMGVPINILNIQGKQLDRTRIYSDQKMKVLKKEHGVQCYLDETFTAPDPVMIALQIQASVHKTLVGGETTQDSVDNKNLKDFLTQPDRALGQNKPQASCIFTAQGNKSFRYTQSLSRYGSNILSKSDEVRPARLLAPGVSPEKKQKVEEQLQQVHSEISALRPDVGKSEKAVKDLEAETQNKHLEAGAAKKAREQFQKFELKLERQRQKVQDAENALEGNDDEEKKTMAKQLLSRLGHTVNALRTHGEQQSLMMKHTTANAGAMVNRATLNTAERSARQAVQEGQQAFQKLEEEARRVSAEFSAKKKTLAVKKAKADAEAPLEDKDGNELPLKSELENLEFEGLVEVDAALEEALKLLHEYDANPDVIRQYEKLKSEIEDIEAKLEDINSSKNAELQVINEERAQWEMRLGNHIDKINNLFSQYMEEVGCTGEVRLTKGDEDSDKAQFKKWGLEILVSFRDGAKAQVLDERRHSGGERSVSTIMFLMALQDLMVAPFRCVDEINQGLDERNERLVFKRIVENSTSEPKSSPTDHSGQYFLITPKLLPNLTTMEQEAVTILFVLNGRYNLQSNAEWNIDAIAKTKSAISNEAENDEENSGESNTRRKSKKARLSED